MSKEILEELLESLNEKSETTNNYLELMYQESKKQTEILEDMLSQLRHIESNTDRIEN